MLAKAFHKNSMKGLMTTNYIKSRCQGRSGSILVQIEIKFELYEKENLKNLGHKQIFYFLQLLIHLYRIQIKDITRSLCGYNHKIENTQKGSPLS